MQTHGLPVVVCFVIMQITHKMCQMHLTCFGQRLRAGIPNKHVMVGNMSRGSVVGIATGLRAGRSEVRIPVGARDFSLLQNIQTGSGAQPASYVMVPGVKRLGREVNHSPEFSAEVQNEWILLYAFMAWTGKTMLAISRVGMRRGSRYICGHRVEYPFGRPLTRKLR
jgi:hypothetical protein